MFANKKYLGDLCDNPFYRMQHPQTCAPTSGGPVSNVQINNNPPGTVNTINTNNPSAYTDPGPGYNYPPVQNAGVSPVILIAGAAVVLYLILKK